MDQSAGLLLANVGAFTAFKSVHQYLDHCFEILHSKISSNEKSTLLRFDRSHVVKTIQRNFAVKKGINKTASNFYKRLLGYLIQQTDVEVIERVINQMFVVLNNQFMISSEFSGIVKSLESIAFQHKIDAENFKDPTLSDFNVDIDSSTVYGQPKNKFNGWILGMAAKSHDSLQNDSSNEGILVYYLCF